MGDFSRDPDLRLRTAREKHYVAVRLQQGVPILDADWNTLDDVRRSETEDYGRWSIGDGVPFGNDGFAIVPIAGGGVDTLVLTSLVTDNQLSSLRVDVVASTAAAVLGFDTNDCFAQRLGSSVARLTSNAAAPFALFDGATLVVTVNEAAGGAPETVTFHSGSFVNIAAATAAEVCAVIALAATRFNGTPGAGNDFIVRGGDGTTDNAGRIVVGGRAALNESDVKYTEQPLFENAALAARWGVSTVPLLTSSTEAHVAFLDLWDREVDSEEDQDLVDDRIGVETATRLRREWAVRMVRETDYPATLAAKPSGHSYYQLARVTRGGNGSPVTQSAIQDLRDTDVSLLRGVLFRSPSGLVLVDTTAFGTLLTDTRNAFRDFVVFLSTKFVTPDTAYLAGEVAGLQSLETVARIADQGLALAGARSLDWRGALELMAQLQDAETRFVNLWTTGVLPLVKASGKIYQVAFQGTIDRITALLSGPAPSGFTALTQTVQNGNLFEAVRTQERINLELAQESERPIGTLLLTYLGSPTPTIVRNQSFDLRFRVTGDLTPQDPLDVSITIDNAWGTTLRNGDLSLPFDLSFGPGSDMDEFVISVLPPDLAVAETDIGVRISARDNSSGLYYFIAPKHLRIGDPPPPSDLDLGFSIKTTSVQLVGDTFQVSTASHATFVLRLTNNTNTAQTIDLDPEPPSPPNWSLIGPPILTNRVIPAQGFQDFTFQFVPPGSAGQTLAFTLNANNSATHALVASIALKLASVDPSA